MGLARLKVARLSAIFPAAAIEGMLAAIGLMIMVKQIPLFLGQKFHAHGFLETLQEVPGKLSSMNYQVFGLGIACLAGLFLLTAIPSRLFKVLPPAVWVFVGGTIVARLFLSLGATDLIHVPAAGIVLPNFQGLVADSSLWLPLTITVVTLLLVDGTESLATISAVDKLDPFRRKSNPDRTLMAMGVCNVCSSVVGGLTIIPGIVKSTANILGGGRTQWANFYNACCLLLMLLLARDLINMVPTCILASILVFIGFKLSRPKVWLHMASIGKEQVLIFTATVLITVTTDDLLAGILSGVLLKLLLVLWYIPTPTEESQKRSILGKLIDLFRNPVGGRDYQEGVYTLTIVRPLVCFNLFHLIRELDRVPSDAQRVQLHLSVGATLIDHTTYEQFLHYLEQFSTENGKPPLEIKGLERMQPLSSHESSIRLVQQNATA